MNFFKGFKKQLENFTKEPDLRLDSVLDIEIKYLREHGIKYMILDLDQTFAIQSTTDIPDSHLQQLKIFIAFLGKDNVCFLSNEITDDRANKITSITGIQVIRTEHKKPDIRAYESALEILKTSAGKHVLMIGDRLWTDIFGAKKMDLSTIQVKPLTPIKEKVSTSIMRSFEELQTRFGPKIFFGLFADFCGIIGLSAFQILYFLYNSIVAGTLTNPNGYFPVINLILIIFSNIYYWVIVVSNSKSFSNSEYKNYAVFSLSTWPLFFRYSVSILFWLISSFLFYYYQLPIETIVIVANFYCLYTHILLVSSLFSIYHSYEARIIRIILDIIFVAIFAFNLPPEFSIYPLFLLLIPIATSAKYYGKPTMIFTWIASSTITFVICFFRLEDVVHPLIFSLLFLGIITILNVSKNESTGPVNHLIKLLKENSLIDSKIISLLKMFARVINCEGVYFINAVNSGFYYLDSSQFQYGELDRQVTAEIYNYLSNNPANIISEPQVSALDVKQKQDKLLKDFKHLPLKYKLRSIIVLSFPNDSSKYLIFTNNITLNGVTQRKFSIGNLRTAAICCMLLSNSEMHTQPMQIT